MPDWTLVYDRYEPQAQGRREALCALGNGYFCTRSAFPHVRAGGPHYPGTYLAGGYNRLVTHIAGRDLESEDLVNLPNWLPLRFRVLEDDDAAWLDALTGELLEFRQALDLRRGVLGWRIRFRDRRGRTSRLELRRLVSMDDMHLAAQELTLVPEDWSGTIELESALDGGVTNCGVPRYRDLNGQHLNVLDARPVTGERSGAELCLLVSELSQARLRIAQAARTLAYDDGQPLDTTPRSGAAADTAFQAFHLPVHRGRPLRIEKTVALHSARDRAISEPGLAAVEAADAAEGFAVLLARHARAWSRLWARCDLELDCDPETQRILRLHIFHLLQTVSPHSVERDVGVPARGWHGEAYRGHVFWDELFILPFLNHCLPDISAALLRYRHNRLPRARRTACDAGLRGAMFPWQSGSDGREENAAMHLNPRSGRWLRDNTHLQRHVSLAICFNVWSHYQATGGRGFIETDGADLLVESARLFDSLATYDAAEDRFEIRNVMGPDEYHDGYPGADRPGIHNNAYTNVMVAWLMRICRLLLARLDADARVEIIRRLKISAAERRRWKHMSRRMKVCFHPDPEGLPVISQFEGYEQLRELDWGAYRKRYGNIQRLDRILDAEGDHANHYKVSKQADVLMLFYLFSPSRLGEVFARLGYPFDEDAWRRNIDYYLARTSHGSTLSYVVHSWVMARSHPEEAWQLFLTALRTDTADIQGGTTAEGIHLGAMAGTVDLVQRCFTGLEAYDDALHFSPVLAGCVKALRLKLRYREHWLDVRLTRDALTLRAHPGWPHPITVHVLGERHTLAPGERKRFPLKRRHGGPPT